MERIDAAGRPIYSPTNSSKKKVKKKGKLSTSFAEMVEGESLPETGNSIFEELGLQGDVSLEQMLDAIHSVGDQIRENANRDTVGKYRQAVKAFMQHVLSNALAVDVKSSSPNILRQKKFTVVKVIDQKLERLASGVLTNQQDTLEILARVDEINGLLVDLIS